MIDSELSLFAHLRPKNFQFAVWDTYAELLNQIAQVHVMILVQMLKDVSDLLKARMKYES